MVEVYWRLERAFAAKEVNVRTVDQQAYAQTDEKR